MSRYKVPQDVEAEDKLIGPFTFRQFIYLIIVVLAGALAYFLGTIFIVLAIIPMPIIIFFGALALPLRKDQPMETYMAAIVSFYLKPHRRLWSPDGQDSLIEITAPKEIETSFNKDITQDEAERRISYLAQIIDSRGWAIRGPGVQSPNNAVNADIYFEAQQTEDYMDESSLMGKDFDSKLVQSNQKHRQNVLNEIKAKTMQMTVQPSPNIVSSQPNDQKPTYDPYPEMHQSVVQPQDINRQWTEDPEPSQQNTPDTSDKAPSADIMELANSELSVATIADQANRKAKAKAGEVYVSLR